MALRRNIRGRRTFPRRFSASEHFQCIDGNAHSGTAAFPCALWWVGSCSVAKRDARAQASGGRSAGRKSIRLRKVPFHTYESLFSSLSEFPTRAKMGEISNPFAGAEGADDPRIRRGGFHIGLLKLTRRGRCRPVTGRVRGCPISTVRALQLRRDREPVFWLRRPTPWRNRAGRGGS